MTAPSDPSRRLFDYFIVVGIGDGADESTENQTKHASEGRVATYLKYRFPQRQQTNSFMKSIAEFCFPDASTITSKKSHSETFSFVLTETNGEKRWGYCRRTASIPDFNCASTYSVGGHVGTTKNPRDEATKPVCFCIISFIPCFKMFSQILDEMIKRAKNDQTGSFDACTVFLNAIYQQPLPAPGGTLSIHVPIMLDREDKERYDFTRPDDSDSLLEHVNFEPYLRRMDPFAIVSIFISMIIERRFIFVADRLSILSACVQAAVALLYPFSWQHIFIPVLPRSLLSFCCAPMPFCIGILRDGVPELKKMSDAMEEVILVDIDNNKVIAPQSMQEDIELVPQALLEPLLSVVSAKCKEVKSNYSLWNKLSGAKRKKEMPLAEAKNFANAFIAFMVDILGSYRTYLDSNKGVFDKESFVAQQIAELQPFLEQVTQSQMFEMFIADRIGRNKQVNQGRFERRVTKRVSSGQIRSPRTDITKIRGSGQLSSVAVRRSKRDISEAPRSAVPARSRFTMFENGELTRDEITREETGGRNREKDPSPTNNNNKEKKRDLAKRSTDDGAMEIKDRPLCKYGENCRSDNPHHWVAYQHTPAASKQQGESKRGGKGMGFFLGKLLGEILEDSPPVNEDSSSTTTQATATLSYVSTLTPSESASFNQAGMGSRRERSRAVPEPVVSIVRENETRRQRSVVPTWRERRDESTRPPLPRLAGSGRVNPLDDQRSSCTNGVLCSSQDPGHWIHFKHTPADSRSQ